MLNSFCHASFGSRSMLFFYRYVPILFFRLRRNIDKLRFQYLTKDKGSIPKANFLTFITTVCLVTHFFTFYKQGDFPILGNGVERTAT